VERGARFPQRAHVLGEAPAQILLHLGEEPELLEERGVGQEEPGPLRERGLAPEDGAPRVADLLGCPRRPEARERLVQRARIDPEPGRRVRPDSARSAQRVQELVALAPGEGAREPVVLEEPREVRVAGFAAGGGAKGPERLDECLPPGAHPAHEPLQHRAPLREQELVHQGRRWRVRHRGARRVSRAPDDDGRRRALRSFRDLPSGGGGRRGSGIRLPRSVRRVPPLRRILARPVAFGCDVGGRPAREVGEREWAERPGGWRVGEQRADREQLVPPEVPERSLERRGSRRPPGLRTPARRALEELCVQIGHGAQPAPTSAAPSRREWLGRIP
jgi:hypothetical protein